MQSIPFEGDQELAATLTASSAAFVASHPISPRATDAVSEKQLSERSARFPHAQVPGININEGAA